MSENEKPVIGTSEAAVLTVVELIARAAQMSEQHMAYWLDLYYQVRSRHEAEKGATADDCYCLLERISDTLDAIRWTPTALGPVEETEDGPSRTPAPTEEPEDGRQVSAPTEQDWKRAHGDAVDALAFAMAGIAPPHAPASVLTATLEDFALAATGKKTCRNIARPYGGDRGGCDRQQCREQIVGGRRSDAGDARVRGDQAAGAHQEGERAQAEGRRARV